VRQFRKKLANRGKKGVLKKIKDTNNIATRRDEGRKERAGGAQAINYPKSEKNRPYKKESTRKRSKGKIKKRLHPAGSHQRLWRVNGISN